MQRENWRSGGLLEYYGVVSSFQSFRLVVDTSLAFGVLLRHRHGRRKRKVKVINHPPQSHQPQRHSATQPYLNFLPLTYPLAPLELGTLSISNNLEISRLQHPLYSQSTLHAATAMDNTLDNTATETIDLLEARLRRIEYAINGQAGEATTTTTHDASAPVAKRLADLEQSLHQVTSRSRVIQDLLTLR
jgi:hypothetical protein